MKIYQEKKEDKKSWAIKLCRTENGTPSVYAVDSKTGEKITGLITFQHDGAISSIYFSKDCLKHKGYDPYEHNNEFHDNGDIVIK